MKKSKLIFSIIASLLFVGLIRLFPFLRISLGIDFWLLCLLIFVLFNLLIILFVREIIYIFRKRKTLKLSFFVPSVIIILLLYDGIMNPLNIDMEFLNNLDGKVIFRACFEGTQNSAEFKLRDNGHFDLRWIGAFFGDERFLGTYKIKRDTLYLKYDGKIAKRLGEKIFMDNKNKALIPIPSKRDSKTYNGPYFYYGFCHGYN